jgi:hypothetical protein
MRTTRTNRDLVAETLILAALVAVIWWSKYPHVLLNVKSSMAHCYGIDTTVAASLRRHWALWAHLMLWLYGFFPPSETTFARIETLLYAVPLGAYALLMYGLCRRFAGTLGSLVACLYLLIVYEQCWYNNFMNPQDPWGLVLSVFIVQGILDRNLATYAISLLVSGMVWEKAYLVPFSLLVSDLLENQADRWWRFCLGLSIVAWAVLAWEYMIPMDKYGMGTCTPADFVNRLGSYIGAWLVMFGPAVTAIFANWKRTPTIFKALALQFPIWAAIYCWCGPCSSEMRGIIIMATFTFPVLALALDPLPSIESEADHDTL